MELEELFGFNLAERIHELLEDFEVVATLQDTVLIANNSMNQSLRENIQAAIVASALRLSSIDYTKKRYCKERHIFEGHDNETLDAKYISAYKSAKQHIEKSISRLSTEGQSLPSNGVFGASLVLERLPSSFFSAHLLYRLGHRYEAHAISRLILEQIAWAHAAYPLDDINEIKNLVTTKTISKLKVTIPESGKLYGFLSKKTHIDYNSHFEFLHIENDENVILHTQSEYYEYAQVILYLADLFGIVWELSQFKYLKEVESIQIIDSINVIREDRPFKKIIEKHLIEIKKCNEKNPDFN